VSSADHSPRKRLAPLAAAIVAAGVLAHASIAASAPPASVTYYASPLGTGACTTPATACSLAGAVNKAEAHDVHGSAVTVQLAAGSYPPVAITGGSEASLTLAGAGAASTVLTGEGQSRTLSVAPGKKVAAVTIEHLTLEDGNEKSADGGNLYVGAIAKLELVGDSVTGGQAADGGGGIAVAAADTVEISESTISEDADGALLLQKGAATVSVDASTLTANPEGAIEIGAGAPDSSLQIESSTIAGNVGGAMTWEAPGEAALYGSTVSGTTGKAALALDSSTGTTAVQLGGDILSENEASCAVAGEGELVDDGYNLAEEDTCGLTQPTSKSTLTAAELDLGALAGNGGPTETQRITSASIAHDAVPIGAQLGEDGPVLCAGSDQRGIARAQPSASACDAGAYQVAPPTLSTSSSSFAEAGVTLQLSGNNLSDVSAVTFGAGAAAATITSQSAISLSVVVPKIEPGPQTITVTNADGSAQLAFTLIANPAITTSVLPAGVRGVAYSAQVQATGGLPLYKWSAAGLPPGLAINAFSGRISGVPTGLGRYTPTETVTDQNGVAASAHLAIVVTAPPVTCASGTVSHGACVRTLPRPVISRLGQSHLIWREGGALARITRLSAPRKPPIGTSYSFTLNEQATVVFVFARQLAGRKVNGKCVAPSRKNAKRRRCKRSVGAGKLSFAAHGAANKLFFQGRISRKHRLAPGSYMLTIIASNSGGSTRRSLSFTIVK
jgi:hypothetical protein